MPLQPCCPYGKYVPFVSHASGAQLAFAKTSIPPDAKESVSLPFPTLELSLQRITTIKPLKEAGAPPPPPMKGMSSGPSHKTVRRRSHDAHMCVSLSLVSLFSPVCQKTASISCRLLSRERAPSRQGTCGIRVTAQSPGREELFCSDEGERGCFYQPEDLGRFGGPRVSGLCTQMSLFQSPDLDIGHLGDCMLGVLFSLPQSMPYVDKQLP